MSENGSGRGATLAVAGIVPIAVGGLLVPLRDDLVDANQVLILVVTVVAGAVIGGRAGGAFAAVTAALSFDFFLARPYLSLDIEETDDLVTTVLLLAVGLLVGQVALRSRVHLEDAERGRSEIERLRRLAELVASGDGADVLPAAQAELTGLFDLESCRFVPGVPDGSRPYLERTGAVHGQRAWRFTGHDLALPAAGVDLPVSSHGRSLGRFVLVPRAGAGASLEARVVSVAIADLVGAVIGAGGSSG